MKKKKGAGSAYVRAVVSRVFENKDEPYALAYINEGSSVGVDVTFSLRVWRGEVEPQKGQVVELEDVRLFAGGWRAGFARPVTLQG